MKLLTKFGLLLQPYLISRNRLQTCFPATKYSYGFSDHLLHFFFIVSFVTFYDGSQYLATTVVVNRYCTPRFTNVLTAIS